MHLKCIKTHIEATINQKFYRGRSSDPPYERGHTPSRALPLSQYNYTDFRRTTFKYVATGLWFGHVEHSTGWISEVRRLNMVAQKRSGRPRKSWDEVIKNDRKKLDIDSADPQNCSEWRARLRGSPTLRRGNRL